MLASEQLQALKAQCAPLRTIYWPQYAASPPTEITLLGAPVQRPYLNSHLDAHLQRIQITWTGPAGQLESEALHAWALLFADDVPRAQLLIARHRDPHQVTLLSRADRLTTSEMEGPRRDKQAEAWRHALLPLSTPALAAAYLRDFWRIEQTDPDVGQLLTTPEDVEWFTPLRTAEQAALEHALGYIAPDPEVDTGAPAPRMSVIAIHPDGNEYRVEACVLGGTDLVEMSFLLIDGGEPPNLQHYRHRGELRTLSEPFEVKHRVSGLPRNWRPVLERWPGTVHRVELTASAALREVCPLEAEFVIADVNRHVRPHLGYGRGDKRDSEPEGISPSPPDVDLEDTDPLQNAPQDASTAPEIDLRQPVLWRRWIACYGLYLLEHQEVYGIAHRVCLLWRPGFAHPIDWRLSTLRGLNRALAEHCDWHIHGEQQAADYLRFLYERVWEDQGPSHLLETWRSDGEYGQRLAKGRVVAQDGRSLEQILQSLQPLAPLRQVSADGELLYFVTRAHLLDTQHLYQLDIKVWPDGDIAAEHKTPLIRLADDENGPKPPRTGPATVARLARAGGRDQRAQELAALLQRPQRDQGEPVPPIRRSRAPEGEEHQRVIRHLTIIGELRIENMELGVSVIFVGCRFRGRVFLNSLNVNGILSFDECVFEDGIELKRNRLAGELRLVRSAVLGHPIVLNETHATLVVLLSTSSQRGLRARRVRAGELRLLDVVLDVAVDLVRAQVRGQIEIAGRRKRRPDPWPRRRPTPPFQRWVYLGGHVNLTGVRADSVHLHYVTVQDHLHFDSSIIAKYISVAFAEVHGDFILHHTVVENGYAWFTNVAIRKGLFARYMRVRTSFYIDAVNGEPSRIGETLCLNQSEVPKVFRVRNTVVGGAIEAVGLQANEVCIGGGRALGGYSGAWDATRRDDEHRWHAKEHTRVGQHIDLSNARVAHNIEFVGLVVEGQGCRRAAAVQLRQVRVDGDVLFFVTEDQARTKGLVPARRHLPSGGLHLTAVGGVDMTKAKVDGDIVASHIICSEGLLNFTDVRIGRNLTFRSDASGPGNARAVDAEAQALLMHSIDCGGTADLSGLTLISQQEPHACASNQVRPGSITARHARFAERLVITCDSTPNCERSATIPSTLDLSESSIGTFIISSRSFDGDGDPTVQGVSLHRATIGKLKVLLRDGSQHKSNYPSPIDLRYATVHFWEFVEPHHTFRPNGSGSDDAKHYLGFLHDDQVLHLHTWQEVENRFRSTGNNRAADRLHREMRRWARGQLLQRTGPYRSPRTLRGALEWLSSRAKDYVLWLRLASWDYLSRAETSIRPLALWIFCWLCATTWFFNNPANLAPSESYLAQTVDPPADIATPDRRTWDWSDSLFIALRYHVPLALFSAHDDWEPHNHGPLDLSHLPLLRNHTQRLQQASWLPTPEGYANCVLGIHWVALPMIVLIFSRTRMRRP